MLGVALFEFYRMVEKDTSHAISKIFNITLGGLIFFSVFLHLENINSFSLPIMIMIYLLILIASLLFIRREVILLGIIYSVFGQLYIPLPLSLLMLFSYSYHFIRLGEGIAWFPILLL